MTTTEPTRASTKATEAAASNGQRRSPDEIEAEIVEARQNLAASLDLLADRTKPSNIAKRSLAKARGVVQNPDGSIRPKQIAIVAGVVLVLVVYRIRKSRLD